MKPISQLNPIARRDRIPLILLFAMVLIYVYTFSILTINMQNRFWTTGYDLGIQDQGVWLLSQGKVPFSTVRGLHLFGDHITFVHVLISPIYWLWDDVRALLVFQSLALGSGAIPLYLIGRHRLKDRWTPLLFSFSYLLYPAIHYLNLWQFHPDSLAVPLLLWAFYFAALKKAAPYFIFIGLTMLCKEEISLAVFAMGLYVAATWDRRIGLYTSALSLIWLVLVFKVFLPHFNGFGYFRQLYGYNVFGNLGSTPAEAAWNTLIHPIATVKTLLSQTNRMYLFNLGIPVAGLSLLSPLTLAIAVPNLLANTLSGYYYTNFIEYHYTAPIIPFIFISAIYGLSKLKGNKILYRAAMVMLLISSLYGNIYIGPSKTSLTKTRQIVQTMRTYDQIRPGYEESVYRALERIPTDASVSADTYFVPHLSHRVTIYEFPNPFEPFYWGINGENPPPVEVEYILLKPDRLKDEGHSIISQLIGEELFGVIYEDQGVMLLKKTYAGSLEERYSPLKG